MNINAKMGILKEKHPERFCPEKGCLWQTAKLNHATQQFEGGGRCLRHGGQCDKVVVAECDCKEPGKMLWCSSRHRAAFDL